MTPMYTATTTIMRTVTARMPAASMAAGTTAATEMQGAPELLPFRSSLTAAQSATTDTVNDPALKGAGFFAWI